MLKADRLVMIIGVVVVILSVALAFATGDTERAEPAGGGGSDGGGGGMTSVTWDTSSTTMNPIAGSDSNTGEIEIPIQNLTAVIFTLTWTDEEPVPTIRNADMLTLSVSGPDEGLTGEQTDTNGEIEVLIQVGSMPTNTSVTADELAALNSSYGSGTWSYAVDVVPYPLRDPGNDWDLTVTYQFYEAVIVTGETSESENGTGPEPPSDEIGAFGNGMSNSPHPMISLTGTGGDWK